MVAFELILEAVSACFGWADKLLTSSGYLSYFLGIIIITIVFDKIISPMLRGRGSDRADRRRNKEGDDS